MTKKKTALLPIIIGVWFLFGCSTAAPQATPSITSENTKEAENAPINKMLLFTAAFENEGVIPLKYGMPPFDAPYGQSNFRCVGNEAGKENLSPPMEWSNIPAETKSLVLVMVDMMSYAHNQLPENAVFLHWLVYNIPPDTKALPEAKGGELVLPNGASEGKNNYPEEFKNGYGGPCPPLGEEHQYVFKLYALDAILDKEPEILEKGLLTLNDIEAHKIAEAEWVGYYVNQ